MPCTPDNCDLHDYAVHPGSGWCRAVDTAYYRSLHTSRSSSRTDEDLAGAILRLGDILERMERQPKWSPPSTPQKRERKGGTPL